MNGLKDPWPRVLSLPGARVVCWRPHPAGTWQYVSWCGFFFSASPAWAIVDISLRVNVIYTPIMVLFCYSTLSCLSAWLIVKLEELLRWRIQTCVWSLCFMKLYNSYSYLNIGCRKASVSLFGCCFFVAECNSLWSSLLVFLAKAAMNWHTKIIT